MARKYKPRTRRQKRGATTPHRRAVLERQLELAMARAERRDPSHLRAPKGSLFDDPHVRRLIKKRDRMHKRGVRTSQSRSRRIVAQGYDVERVHVNRQGYDARGRYWGTGAPLYRITVRESGLDQYVRAPSAKAAREKVRAERKKSYRGGWNR